MSAYVAYIPGKFLGSPKPLARYLPPIPGNVVTTWLQENLRPGSWVLDPFGAAPDLAVEAARAGYHVLVAANNPVARFLLEMAADPPTEQELSSALADLAASYKGSERIEPHIRSLYMTDCAKCGKEIMVDSFLWERGAQTPFGRLYTCPHCGDAGEREATKSDALRASRFTSSGLHRARALERVVSPTDPDRAHAEEALEAYLPRSVYVLFTLINKLDGLSLTAGSTQPKNRLLTALILAALDRTNTLWPYPSGRARPRQLTTPPRFREHNAWLALEEAVNLWASPREAEVSSMPIATWPDVPGEEAGISIFEGRLKDLGTSLKQIRIGAVLGGLPRPNQAYWTLSALWAGWLWGREAATPFKSVLRRRRYDWAWHCTALHAAFQNLAQLLEKDTPMLGLIGETEPGFLSATLIASKMAAFTLEGIALRAEEGQTQINWKVAGRKTKPVEIQHSGPAGKPAIAIEDISTEAAYSLLRERGEPADYISLHAAALSAISGSDELPTWQTIPPADVLQQINAQFQQIFSLRGGFLRFGGSEHSLEIGKWWLRDKQEKIKSDENSLPLADRVEVSLVRYLLKKRGVKFEELDRELCQNFPGLLTPNPGLIQACLASYAEQEDGEESGWRVRKQDFPAARHADLREMSQLLEQVGAQLGYSIHHQIVGPFSQRLTDWRDTTGEVQYAFYLLASAVFGEIFTSRTFPPGKSIIVFPGGRANLVTYKLETNPLLRQAVEAGWRFVKFRQLRRIARTSHLEQANIDDLFALDPVSQSDPQMPLF